MGYGAETANINSLLNAPARSCMLGEWKISSYRLMFPPHRMISSFVQLDYALVEDTIHDGTIDFVRENIQFLARYTSSAFACTEYPCISLPEEIKLLEHFLQLKKNLEDHNSNSIDYSITTSIPEDTLPNSLLLPVGIILPYVTMILRGYPSRQKELRLSIAFSEAPSREEQQYISCTVEANTAINYRKDALIWEEPTIVEQRQQLLSQLLGVSWKVEIIGDVATSREELRHFQQRESNVCIHFNIPVLNPRQQAIMEGRKEIFLAEATA